MVLFAQSGPFCCGDTSSSIATEACLKSNSLRKQTKAWAQHVRSRSLQAFKYEETEQCEEALVGGLDLKKTYCKYQVPVDLRQCSSQKSSEFFCFTFSALCIQASTCNWPYLFVAIDLCWAVFEVCC